MLSDVAIFVRSENFYFGILTLGTFWVNTAIVKHLAVFIV